MPTQVDNTCYVGPEEEPDKYRLVRQVGHGGEAELWHAVTAVAGGWEPVAVKILRSGLQDELSHWRTRWNEQVAVLRRIQHPGVVGVHESFQGRAPHRTGQSATQTDHRLYLVMNWIEGHTLGEWVALHRQAEDYFTALRILAQVAGTLNLLHDGQATSRRPVVHGDLTPANVIVNPEGQAVLVDFGLLRVAQQQGQAAEGTRGYWAPEVVAAGAYSPASDRYAFGALTAYVLTGEHPVDDLRVMRARLGALPATAADRGLLDHLMLMLDPDPARRPAPDAWLRRLRATTTTSSGSAGGGGLRPPAPGPAQAREVPPPGRGGRRRALVGTGVAVVLLAALIAGRLAWDTITRAVPGDAGALSGTTSPSIASTPTPAASTPARLTRMPKVSGMPLQEATALLKAGGLQADTETVLDESKPHSTVLRSVPASGEPVTSTVRLVVTRRPLVTHLTEMDAIAGSYELDAGSYRLAGYTYDDSVAASCGLSDSLSVTEYPIDGSYQRFRATLGVVSDPGDYALGTFRVLVDGKSKGTWLVPRDKVKKIDIDVTGGRTLRLENTDKEAVYYCDVNAFVWGGARLIGQP
ncbi:protein kinase domain-containing protein [Nonomuraea dietziae]|uniref:protein kinase domain-containing protein n=1 Tax=Nonomuraea dietziae TaxID=65515 RepID=UPI0034339A4F